MIKPIELYSQEWSKEDKKNTSPNVVTMINNFNKYSNWFLSEVVSSQNVKKRAKILKHIIDIGYVCFFLYFYYFLLFFYNYINIILYY